MSLSLEHLGSDQTLDLGCLGARFLSLLDVDRPPDDVLSDIILLGKFEKLADLGGSLGAQTTRHFFVCQSRNFSLTWRSFFNFYLVL